MEKRELVDKLKYKTNISYEEAKDALENSNWDMLEAMLYLENKGIIKKPAVSVFYSNNQQYEYSKGEEEGKEDYKNNNSENRYNKKNDFYGVFEVICKSIDTCNNILIEIKKDNGLLFKLPLTVVIVLLFFAFWILIPLIIIGLFFGIKFKVYSKNVNTDKANKVISRIEKIVYEIKEKVKRGTKHD
ncbi:ubiquitin [Clostridium sp. D53t1_180928_C8]|uniref:ubiquitin n=1 Tax=Clostridium sp. D53t1_180928_C8 TaxID=2787101 RepID=UPI0018AAAF5A|nr:ubiquitin [Clostridium sp. D53t1_180928_C8]